MVPADFLIAANANAPIGDHHEKLVANALAQTEALATARETELLNLKEQLRESNRRLQELEMGALESSPPRFARADNLGLYIIIALFAIALLVLLIMLLINRRNHQKRQELEWGYGTKVPMGPRPQAVPQQQQPAAGPAPEQPVAPPQKPPAPVDTAALKEEMKSIKQSVISMSVGQPDTASRVINEWLGEVKQAEESESEF